MRAPIAGFLLVLTLLAGCSGPQVLNALTPESGYEAASNLIYDDVHQLRLDIYTPPPGKMAPVVVFFYGGRWTEGDKKDYRFVGQALARRGYVVVIPDYRLYPQVRFPAFVEDAANAVKWTKDNIARYRGDPSKMFVMGHSAGAHIASMLALNEEYLRAAGGSRSWLKGMIGLAGPYDFMPLTDPDLRDMFGPPEDFQKSQPIFFVDGQNPPLLLMHGEDDESVRIKNTRNLASAVAKAGGPVEMVVYPKMSHRWIIATVSSRLSSQSDVLTQITQFIDRIVSGKPASSAMGGVEGTALPQQPVLPEPVAQPLPLPEPLPLTVEPATEPAPAPAQ